MTKEEFKHVAMTVLSNQYVSLFIKGGVDWKEFNSNDIEDYFISECDEYGEEVSSMQLSNFLDKLYEAINVE